ncbi:capsid protein [Delphin virus 2]|nr:capsid protein [Delphin virus 2]QSX73081.1 capsid protein [Delphin virus 2]
MRMSGSPFSRAGYAARIGYYGAKWAAPRIQRWYRKRRSVNRKKRHKVYRRSLPNQRNNSKVHQSGVPGGTNTLFGLGALQLTETIPYPPQASVVTAENQRKNQSIYVKGFKICRTFRNLLTQVGQEIEVHWALIQLKAPSLTTPGTLESDVRVAFFRDNSASSSRTRDFTDYISTDPWSAEFNCLPMAPGNDFNILTHQKRVLAQQNLNSLAFGTRSSNTWKIERYYPYKKWIKFTGDNGFPDRPIYEVYWCNTLDSSGFPADPTADSCSTWHCHTLYFSDNMK